MGICPTSPYVFCGFGEGISLVPCPSGCPVGGAQGVLGSLLRAVQSPYKWSESLVPNAGCKSDSFSVRVGLQFQFGGVRISSLLFADDVVLLAPSGGDLQLSVEWFAAECEAAEMRISPSNLRPWFSVRKG